MHFQVYELHRLYQVQKILMKNMEINKSTTKGNNVISGTFIRRVDHEIDRPANFPGGGESGGNNIEIMDESEIELTLGPSCYGGDLMRMNKKKKKKNSSLPEMMDGDLNSGRRSFSSSSTGSSNNNNLEEQVRLMKHQKQKQPWLQALTLNVI